MYKKYLLKIAIIHMYVLFLSSRLGFRSCCHGCHVFSAFFSEKKEWFVCIDETNFSQILSLLLKSNDIQFHNTLSQDIYAAHFLYISDTQKCLLGSTDVNQWYVEISKFIVFFLNFSSGSSGFNKWLKCKVYRYFA